MEAAQAVQALLGVALLTLGRHLYWLFVGFIGFLVGTGLAAEYLADQPQWIALLLAVLLGVAVAFVAVYVQRFAAGVAGFIAGGNMALALLSWLGFDPGGWSWFVFLLGGIIGGLSIMLLFDWGLVFFSALVGAGLVAPVVPAPEPYRWVLFLALFVGGVVVQGLGLLRAERRASLETETGAQADR